RTKYSPVQKIERLPPEVQAFLFPMQVDAPRQRQVLVESRPIAQLGIVPGLVAEPGGRLRTEEGRGLEEAVDIGVEPARLGGRTPAVVGRHSSPVGAVENGKAHGRSQRDRRPAHILLDPGDAPSAQQRGRYAPAVQIRFPFSEGQLVYVSQLHLVRLVESR